MGAMLAASAPSAAAKGKPGGVDEHARTIPRLDMLAYGASASGDTIGHIPNVFRAAHDGGLEAAVLDISIYPRIAEKAAPELEALNALAADDDAPFIIARKLSDFRAAFKNRRLAVTLGCQDATILGTAFEDFEGRLKSYHGLGLRVLQLTHNARTAFGDSFMEPRDGGLSNEGAALVRSMNKMGVIVDLSHCSHYTLFDTLEISEKPCLVTHAGAYSLAPTKRNKTDDEIRAVAKGGGVFGVYNMATWLTSNKKATIDTLLDHISYIADLVGPDHVGFGSDGHLVRLDAAEELRHMSEVQKSADPGAPSFEWPVRQTRIPELNSPNRMNVLADALSRRGFSGAEVDKITGGNFLRVFEQAVGG